MLAADKEAFVLIVVYQDKKIRHEEPVKRECLFFAFRRL